MRFKCVKPFEGVGVGEVGDFKHLITVSKTPVIRMKLCTGTVVSIPADRCKIMELPNEFGPPLMIPNQTQTVSN